MRIKPKRSRDPNAREKCELALALMKADPELLAMEAAERVGVKPMTLYKRLNRAGIKQDRKKSVSRSRRARTYKVKKPCGRPITDEMREKKRRALNLAEVNPTLSAQRIADHFDVSQATVLKWLREK